MLRSFVPLSLTLTIVAIVVLVVSLWFFGFNPLKKAAPTITPVGTDSRIILLNQLRAVKQLTTTIGSVVTIISSEQSRQFLGMNIGTAKMTFVAVGNVRAGVDLEKLSETDIELSEARPRVVLPNAEIFDVSLDVEKSFILDATRTPITSPNGFELQPAAEQTALTEIRKTAMEDLSILETASQQATAIMHVLGFDVVSN